MDFKSVASGDLRWQEFEDSWIDSVKSSHDFVGLDHVSSWLVDICYRHNYVLI